MSNGDEPSAATGLRARRHAQTVEDIERAALARFRADGFDATTTQAVADDAGLSQRTLFRYCPVKIDTVLAVPGQIDRAVAAALDAVPPASRDRAAVDRAVLDAVAAWESDPEAVRRLRAVHDLLQEDAGARAAAVHRQAAATLDVAARWADEARRRPDAGPEEAVRTTAEVRSAVLAMGAAFEEWARYERPGFTVAQAYRWARP